MTDRRPDLSARILALMADGKPWPSEDLIELAGDGLYPKTVLREIDGLFMAGQLVRQADDVWLLPEAAMGTPPPGPPVRFGAAQHAILEALRSGPKTTHELAGVLGALGRDPRSVHSSTVSLMKRGAIRMVRKGSGITKGSDAIVGIWALAGEDVEEADLPDLADLARSPLARGAAQHAMMEALRSGPKTTHELASVIGMLGRAPGDVQWNIAALLKRGAIRAVREGRANIKGSRAVVGIWALAGEDVDPTDLGHDPDARRPEEQAVLDALKTGPKTTQELGSVFGALGRDPVSVRPIVRLLSKQGAIWPVRAYRGGVSGLWALAGQAVDPAVSRDLDRYAGARTPGQRTVLDALKSGPKTSRQLAKALEAGGGDPSGVRGEVRALSGRGVIRAVRQGSGRIEGIWALSGQAVDPADLDAVDPPRIARGVGQQTVLDALRTGPKTAGELISAVVAAGRQRKAANHSIRELIKRGAIREVRAARGNVGGMWALAGEGV